MTTDERVRVDMRSLRTPGADPRFAIARRGPYWQPGDSVIAEPWVALAEANIGHVAIRHGSSRERALAQVRRWEALAKVRGIGTPDIHSRAIVGAAVVDPHGNVFESWGSVPVPGGAPRWTPLRRLLTPAWCGRCGEHRWTGCYVAQDGNGCALCLPETETADPRVWPPDPIEVAATVKDKRPSARRKAAPVAATADPGDQGALL